MSIHPKGREHTLKAVGIFVLLMAIWVCAWLIYKDLNQAKKWSAIQSFLYWTSCKFIIWILPGYYLLRRSGRTIQQTFNLSNWKAWLFWGGTIGVFIAILNIIPKWYGGRPLVPTTFSFALLNVLLIAPLLEEFLIRGAMFGHLLLENTPATANAISSAMFVVLHIPGWYFMGNLSQMMFHPIGGALSIFLLGLAFGYAAHRSQSTMAAILAHFLNNLTA